ncbi:ATP-binding protein [Dactylosporangium siamense]|uniref:ATP-binding protein n=1 Tax=Dactylosporangium siamense TaxID=685454 RepID=A0A919PKP5_9ACTN|nr:ATP-binding protein [Dactylosporangium siamense]GIG43788.1 ATP-binding protein [Dactylosporangium siamense]
MRNIDARSFLVTITRSQDSVCLALDGALGTAEMPSVRTGLAKCLAEQPVALVIDLLGLDVGAQVVPMFLLMRREARRASGVPLVVVAGAQVREVLRPYCADSNLVATRAEAELIAAGLVSAERWRGQAFAVTPWAAALARDFVTDACAAWDLPRRLLYAAREVVGELVDNAVCHAGADIAVTVAHRRRCLVVQVHDDCPKMPRLLDPVADDQFGLCWRGRGLHTVARLTTAWGAHPVGTGKVVWATLAVEDAPAAGGRPVTP